MIWLLLLGIGDRRLKWNYMTHFFYNCHNFAWDFDLILLSIVELLSYSHSTFRRGKIGELCCTYHLFYESLAKILFSTFFTNIVQCSVCSIGSMSLSTISKVQRFVDLSLHQITSMWTKISCSPPEFLISLISSRN